MTCFFCGDPAAHQATGTRYTASVLACHACTLSFWKWWRQFNHGKAKRPRGGVTPARSFYECAGDHVAPGLPPVRHSAK